MVVIGSLSSMLQEVFESALIDFLVFHRFGKIFHFLLKWEWCAAKIAPTFSAYSELQIQICQYLLPYIAFACSVYFVTNSVFAFV